MLSTRPSPTVFFTKLHVGGVSRTPETVGLIDSKFSDQFVEQDAGLDCTRPAFCHLSSMSLDFREIALYILLEALDVGAPVTFLFDAYSAGSFHIITKGLSADFPKGAEEFDNHRITFLELALIKLLFGLRDIHQSNFCLTKIDQSSLTRKAMLVDFEHSTSFHIDKFPENFEELKFALQQSLMLKSKSFEDEYLRTA
jgi:hypothetical protein